MPAHRKNHNGAYSGAELRAVERSVLGGRRILWAGVLVVVLPLLVLLGLQYLWLADLEHNSAIARKATLVNYLGAVSKEVHYFYLKTAQRVLNLPPEVFSKEGIQKIGVYFKKRETPGIKQLFVVSFKTRESILFFDPKTSRMEAPDFSEETVAVWAAAAPWSYLRKKGGKIETTALSVHQHDPENRIILNPITDEVIVRENELVTSDIARRIEDMGQSEPVDLQQNLQQVRTFGARLALCCISASFISHYLTSINHLFTILYRHSIQIKYLLATPEIFGMSNIYIH